MRILRAICIVLAFFSFRQATEASIAYEEDENSPWKGISVPQSPDKAVNQLSFNFDKKGFSQEDISSARAFVEGNKNTLRTVRIIGKEDYDLTSIFDVLRSVTHLITSFSMNFEMLREAKPFSYTTTWNTFCRGLQGFTHLTNVAISWYISPELEGKRMGRAHEVDLKTRQTEMPSGITRAMAVHLAGSLQGKLLTSLSFGQLTLGDEGLEGLVPVLETMSSLRHLNLTTNNITNRGTLILAGVLRKLNQLETLSLDRSLFGLAGVENIVSALNHPTLKDVSFYGIRGADETNPWDTEGRELTQLFVGLATRSEMLRVISIGGFLGCPSFQKEFPGAMARKSYLD